MKTKKQITISLESEDLAHLDKMTLQSGASRAEVVRKIVRQFLRGTDNEVVLALRRVPVDALPRCDVLLRGSPSQGVIFIPKRLLLWGHATDSEVYVTGKHLPSEDILPIEIFDQAARTPIPLRNIPVTGNEPFEIKVLGREVDGHYGGLVLGYVHEV